MTSTLPSNVFYRLLAGLAWALALTLPLLPAGARAAGWDLDQLMQSLATAKSGRATFVEKKFISLLERPVESSGELRYVAPDRLEKRTVKPSAETMRVDGDVLTIERGRQKHSLQLQAYPDLAGFIDSIRGTLAGDRKALERSFRLQLEGGPERWTLLLFPTNDAIARSVHLVRISGARGQVGSIETIQTDGDRSLMTIQPVPVK
jgi:hypothetical protein